MEEQLPTLKVRAADGSVVLYIVNPAMCEVPQGSFPLELTLDNDLTPELVPYIMLSPDGAIELANTLTFWALQAGYNFPEDQS